MCFQALEGTTPYLQHVLACLGGSGFRVYHTLPATCACMPIGVGCKAVVLSPEGPQKVVAEVGVPTHVQGGEVGEGSEGVEAMAVDLRRFRV